ncbi:MAG TPA: hypothetical protein VNM68_03365, partial [Candidatus Polarisedimenticolia bacterium]|nr:hypothetical protein [Candidatus Polarisedimenticolia bacterium]
VGIREAKSLDELVQQYDTAHRLVKDYEADESNPKIEYGERAQTEPYKSELRLREAIIEWETKSRIISETRLYWMFGLLFLAVGLAAYRWLNSLLTMSALIVAFSEMIYWSSPSYFSGFSQEFDRLLTNKLILALSSFLLLLIVAYVTKTFDPGGPSTQRAS